MMPSDWTLTPGAQVDSLQIERLLTVAPDRALYRAHDTSLGRAFLLQEYLPEGLAQRAPDGDLRPLDEAATAAFESGREGFLEGARQAAVTTGEGLLDITRLFEHGGTAYRVLPWRDADWLPDRLAGEQPFAQTRLKHAFLGLAESLARLHAHGQAHGAVQPDHLLIDREDRLWLVLPGGPVAESAYQAPESNGAPANPAEDLYGLSATLYHCLAGQPPPTAAERQAALASGVADPLDLDSLASNTSEGLRTALEQGLALDPAERPADLERWRLPLTSIDWRREVAGARAEKAERREWLAPMLLGSLLALLAVATVYLLFASPDTTPDSEPGAGIAATPEATPRPLPPDEETLRWQAAVEADTLLAYREFLGDFPTTRYREQAQVQLDILDNELWKRLSAEESRESYADYLAQFPLGIHHLEALRRIDEMDREAARIERERLARERQDNADWEAAATARSIAAMDAYLAAWPNGLHADRARVTRAELQAAKDDERAFASARSLNTPEALQAYIQAFPQGTHVAEALTILDTIDLRPGKRFRDCPECPTLIVLPAGSFEQGSPEASELAVAAEKPRRTVSIAEPFAIGVYEVTLAEWDACVDAGGCRQRPGDNGWGRGRRPVIMVSWNDVQEYLAWISERTGQAYRLPSESEWEYAARAGEAGDWLGGSNNAVCRHGNVAGAETDFRWRHPACSDAHALGTTEIGQFEPNAFGLHDVVGNVAEWTGDCMNLSYLGAPVDGSAWGRGICSQHMTRGGSWVTGTRDIRLPARFNLMNGDRNDFTGFRVVRKVED